MTSRSDITCYFGRAMTGTNLKPNFAYFESKKSAFQIFSALLKLRNVFYRYQTTRNKKKKFRVICTLSYVGSQGYYHRYGQILAQSFQGCCVCLVLCSALEEGMHKTYLLRFAFFQCTLHAQLCGLVPRYRTKSCVSRLIFPLQASPDRVFSHKEQRW